LKKAGYIFSTSNKIKGQVNKLVKKEVIVTPFGVDLNLFRPSAAYTAVDQAEDEKELCYKVNVLGTKYVLQICSDINAKMVYISTDYVFDGQGEKPFEVTDKPNLINYYGKTKHEGELEVQEILEKYFIIRVSRVFGSNGNNFVKTMLKLGKEKDRLNVVSDQIGSPTYTYNLAKLISDMIATDKYGIYHATNEGYYSWYEFACEIFRLAGLDRKVNPVKTEDYHTKAVRPRNSRLSKKSIEEGAFAKFHAGKKLCNDIYNHSK
jgi:dTDP-4-dehydrorhamnose reductase